MATLTTGLKVKENGAWTKIGKVYKKISGVWVEQSYNDLNNIFDTNSNYRNSKPNPVAILYSDGSLVFQDSDVVDSNHGDVVASYYGWHIDSYGTTSYPWRDYYGRILNVDFNTIVSPSYTKNWFNSCRNITSINTNNFDTSNITNMCAMFGSCNSLTSLDLSSFNTSKVTDMSLMFAFCTALTYLNLSSFDTSNVTDMHQMFDTCKITSLDLSSFDTSNVTDMRWMFDYCTNLISLDLSSFDMTNVTKTANMFGNCTNLQTIYVKDETAKTKIESSVGFPTTATVIIGKPA
jgi:surface protein